MTRHLQRETGLAPSHQITPADLEHAKAQWRQDVNGPMQGLLDARPTKEDE